MAKDAEAIIPDAHDPEKKHRPTMLTTDLSLRVDPAYEKISRAVPGEPRRVRAARSPRPGTSCCTATWARSARYLLGPWVPEPQLWQDPVPAVDHELVDEQDVAALKAAAPRLRAAVSAAGRARRGPRPRRFRRTDKRGGANGARIRLEPQRSWEVNQPDELGAALRRLERGPAGVQRRPGRRQAVSLADLIVLGGCAAVEKAARDAGVDVTVPFTPGRTDASQDQTDVESFAVPRAAGGRVPQLRARRARSCSRRRCCSTGRTCWASRRRR